LQLVAIDEFSHKIYAYYSDDKIVRDAPANDVMVLHEVPVPVTQSDRGARTVDSDTIVVPVFNTVRNRPFGRPMFVALNRRQRAEVPSIYRAVANVLTGVVREDKIDRLFGAPAEMEASDDTPTSLRSRKPVTGLYDILVDRSSSKLMPKKPGGMFFGELGNYRESLADRLKPKMMTRITNGISGMISTPNSDDEDEKVKTLISSVEAITLDWKDEAVTELFGQDTAGRYVSDNDYERVEDPAIAVEREKAGRRDTLSLDDCLNEFSKPEVLGEHDLWYCSNVGVLG
jgi:hypothetical protein